MVRVCPKCRTESSEALYCPKDGARLLTRSMLESLERNEDPLVGHVVGGRYRVVAKLGEGGMGYVYRAVQETIQKQVALKVLKNEFSEREDVVARFHQEAVSACRIKHPNVVDVFDFGTLDDGRFFLVMELLEGRDLAQAFADQAPLEPKHGVAIALQICRALNAAHKNGVVHRDLKPENVFLLRTPDGEEIVKIVDFGMALLRAPENDDANDPARAPTRRLTKEGTIFGTPEYMSPEQAMGQATDPRSDVYAVGVILYEMFTGRVPFTGSTVMQILAAHMTEAPPKMSEVSPSLAISIDLERIIARALAKRPEDRFESMARFAEALAATPENDAQPALPLTRPLDDVRRSSSKIRVAPPEREAARTMDAAVLRAPPAKRKGGGWLVALAGLAAIGGGAFVALKYDVASSLLAPSTSAPIAQSAAPSASAPPSVAPASTHEPPVAPPATVRPIPLASAAPVAPASASASPAASASSAPVASATTAKPAASATTAKPAASAAAAKPVTSAAPAASVATTKKGTHAGKGSAATAQPVEPPVETPIATPPTKPASTSNALPTIEHCYETVGDQRREVPCP